MYSCPAVGQLMHSLSGKQRNNVPSYSFLIDRANSNLNLVTEKFEIPKLKF